MSATPTPPEDPGLKINQKVLALILACWAIWTQVKDAVATWVRLDNRVTENTQQVQMLPAVRDLVTQARADVQNFQSLIATLSGDMKAERERSFGAQQNLTESTQRLDASIKELQTRLTNVESKINTPPKAP